MRKQPLGKKEAVREIVRVEKLVEKTCEAPGCDNEFLGLSRQRFCSNACRARFNYYKNVDKSRAEKLGRYYAQKKQPAK